MNEIMVSGWFYLKTDATDNETAVKEFRKACEKVGINADNIRNAIIRDEYGDDITRLQDF